MPDTTSSLKQQQRIAAAMIEYGVSYHDTRIIMWNYNGLRLENLLQWNASWCCRRSFKIIKAAKIKEGGNK